MKSRCPAVVWVVLLQSLTAAWAPCRAARFEYRLFERGRAQEVVAVQAKGAGGLELASLGGRRMARGLWTWRAEHVGTPIRLAVVQAEARVPGRCGVNWELRTLRASDGSLTDWQRVEPGRPVELHEPAEAVQLRVVLTSNSPLASPCVTQAVLVCQESAEREAHPPVRSTSGTAHAPCPAAPELPGGPPPIPGPRVVLPPVPTVDRPGWSGLDAREPYVAMRPGLLTVHHSGLPLARDWHGASTIHGIQGFHMFKRGWSDIAYHFLIAPDGTIFRGRPETAVGSHSVPNRWKLGVCVVGNFNRGEESVSPAARDSLVRLLAYLAGKYGISSRAIYGHRDFNATDCPGDRLYQSLGRLRAEVQKLLEEAETGTRRVAKAAQGQLEL